MYRAAVLLDFHASTAPTVGKRHKQRIGKRRCSLQFQTDSDPDQTKPELHTVATRAGALRVRLHRIRSQ